MEKKTPGKVLENFLFRPIFYSWNELPDNNL